MSTPKNEIKFFKDNPSTKRKWSKIYQLEKEDDSYTHTEFYGLAPSTKLNQRDHQAYIKKLTKL